jgi:hypothetical protein
MPHPTHFFLIHVYLGPREGWGTLTDGPDVQTISDAAYAVLDWFDDRVVSIFPAKDTIKALEIDGGVCLDRTEDVLADCIARFANDDPRDVPLAWRELVGVEE